MKYVAVYSISKCMYLVLNTIPGAMGTHYVDAGTFQLMDCPGTPYWVHWTPSGSKNCDHLLCDKVYTCREKKYLGEYVGFTFRVVLKPIKFWTRNYQNFISCLLEPIYLLVMREKFQIHMSNYRLALLITHLYGRVSYFGITVYPGLLNSYGYFPFLL